MKDALPGNRAASARAPSSVTGGVCGESRAAQPPGLFFRIRPHIKASIPTFVMGTQNRLLSTSPSPWPARPTWVVRRAQSCISPSSSTDDPATLELSAGLLAFAVGIIWGHLNGLPLVVLRYLSVLTHNEEPSRASKPRHILSRFPRSVRLCPLQ
jgi:hypothetical protein